jgi:hypothetical protein
MSNKLFAATVGLLAIGFSLSSAFAASATSEPGLPNQQSLYGLHFNQGDGPSVWHLQSNGLASPIGNDSTAQNPSAASYDPSSGKFYFIDDNLRPAQLSTFDPMTGAISRGPQLSGAADNLWSLIIDEDGNAFGQFVDMTGGSLVSVDLITGETSHVTYFSPNTNPQLISYNPHDDKIYGFTAGSGDVFTIDPESGIETTVHTGVTYATGSRPAPDSGPTGTIIQAVAFDSNGIAWMYMYQMGSNAVSLEAYDPATNESWSMGTLRDSTQIYSPTAPHYWYSTILVIGPAELAFTGIDYGRVTAILAASVLLAIVGVGALVESRRRTLRRNQFSA